MNLLDMSPSSLSDCVAKGSAVDLHLCSDLGHTGASGSLGTSLTDSGFSQNSQVMLLPDLGDGRADTPTSAPHVSDVVGLSPRYEMSRVAADGPVAGVPYDYPIRDCAMCHLIRDAVSTVYSAVLGEEVPVTIGVPTGFPVPAFVRSFHRDAEPKVVSPSHTVWAADSFQRSEWVTVAIPALVVSVAPAASSGLALTTFDGTGTLGHGANSLIVESYAPEPLTRFGGTPIVAGRG